MKLIISYFLAAKEGQIDIIQLLLELTENENVEIDTRNHNSDTPLSLACMEGSIEVAKLLITHGANFKLRHGEKENTLLHLGKNLKSNCSLK